MKKIIVFGASGETGRFFVDYYLKNKKENFEIIAVGGRKTDFFEKYFGVKYIRLDITKQDDFSLLPKDDVHAVVDLAGYMPARCEGEDNYKMLNVNLMGTLNILEYCRKTKCDRIIFAQSFGDILSHAASYPTLTVNLQRNYPLNTDHSVYLIGKCAAVDLIIHYHLHYGLKAFIFRLPTVYVYAKDRYFYKDGVKHTLWYRVLIDKAVFGDDLEIWGDPKKIKDMVYVKDFAQMMYLATFIERDYGFYNVGTGIGTSLEDQIRTIAKMFNKDKKSKIIYRPDMPSTGEYVMDINPAIKELGYKPVYTFEKFLEDYKEEMESGRFDEL